MARIIVVTSGKGGVGKTTTSAAISAALALRGHKTVVVDFDVGLRNLDLIMGCERRVVYDFVNVVQGDASLKQALIKDKKLHNLHILPASQTRDKDALTKEGVEKVLDELSKDFEYIICDSPAGIEHGAHMALYFADEAIIDCRARHFNEFDINRAAAGGAVADAAGFSVYLPNAAQAKLARAGRRGGGIDRAAVSCGRGIAARARRARHDGPARGTNRAVVAVRGMETQEARQRVRAALASVAGVTEVQPGDGAKMIVEYDPTEATVMDLIRALRRIGFLAGME